jgi:hypothetical protein
MFHSTDSGHSTRSYNAVGSWVTLVSKDDEAPKTIRGKNVVDIESSNQVHIVVEPGLGSIEARDDSVSPTIECCNPDLPAIISD